LCTDATCSAASSMSTDKLHERVCAPFKHLDHPDASNSARPRNEVDLDTLSAELLAGVDQTVQPTTMSLWLRPSAPRP
jgi:hypothetical protein